MESQLSRILATLKSPAFLASERAELLYLNEAMRQLVGGENTDRQRTLIGLGIFENRAEFRGFMRGFASVGSIQKIRLPSKRLRHTSREVLLTATFLPEEKLIFGAIGITEKPSLRAVATDTAAKVHYDDLPQLVVCTDGEGKLQYLNHVARSLLRVGQEPDAPLTGGIADVDAEYSLQVWRKHLSQARREGIHTYRTHFLRRGGTLLPVEVSIFSVVGFPVKSATLVATDITEQRVLEKELRALELEVENLRYQRDRDKDFLQDHLGNAVRLDAIVSGNSNYDRVIENINLVAPTDSTVLITGETGTGKELVARAIHAGSHRTREPLVVVNCGALPRELIESELFGYRKGAFTGATRNQSGRFELADQGTLFLDEIGEMPLELQTRLLRFLQEGSFTPVGGHEPVHVDVRIIAATNRNLEAMVREGTFRADLYFRLNVFPIHNPPLRERREDIPLLIDHFIKKHGRRINPKVEKYAPEVLEKLEDYPFYGNIRELENIVERALITSKGKKLTLDWNITVQGFGITAGIAANKDGLSLDPKLTLDEMQKRFIEKVLRKTDGKVSGPGGAAEILGLNPQTLFSKMRKLGVER